MPTVAVDFAQEIELALVIEPPLFLAVEIDEALPIVANLMVPCCAYGPVGQAEPIP